MSQSQCKWYPLCPMRRFYKKGLLSKSWIDAYCKGDWHQCVRYHMEEKGRYHPDWMLPDGTLDEVLKEIPERQRGYIPTDLPDFTKPPDQIKNVIRIEATFHHTVCREFAGYAQKLRAFSLRMDDYRLSIARAGDVALPAASTEILSRL